MKEKTSFFFFFFCLQASGYVQRELCQRGSVRQKSRIKKKKKKWGILCWGSQPLHREDKVVADLVVYLVFCMLGANLCGCLHSACMINH